MQTKFKSLKLNQIYFTILYSFIFAIGLTFFLKNAGLITIGITGVSQILHYFLSENNINIPLGLMIFIINVPGILIAFEKIGFRFATYSLISIITVSLVTDMIPAIVLTDDIILNCVMGGLLMGYSLGGLLRIGSSSGGLDIYALYLFQKYGIEWTKVNNIINISIIFISALAFGTEIALYTIFSYFIRHITMEAVYTNNRKLTVWIVGRDVSKVSSFINTKFGRGTSLFKQVEGGYSREEKEVLMTVLSEFQYKELASMIHKIDESVFVTASRTDKLEGNFAFKKEKK